MKIGEFCNREVVIAKRDESVVTAAARMREHHVGDLVIVTERDGMRYPVAILTDRDIVVGVLASDAEHLSILQIGDVIRPELETAREDADVLEVIRKMRAFGVRRMPIVDARGSLVGIVSFDDLLEHIAEEVTELVELLRREQSRERERRPPLSLAADGGNAGDERPRVQVGR